MDRGPHFLPCPRHLLSLEQALITLMVRVQDSAQCQGGSTMKSNGCMREAGTDLQTVGIRSKLRVSLVALAARCICLPTVHGDMFGDAHHWDVEYDYTLPKLGKEARHSVSDCQLRFRFPGKDRCRKTSEPHFFLQTNLQRMLQKMAARAHLFSEAGLWKSTIPS